MVQVQRQRFAEYWRRKWVPQWLGLQLGRIGPILFRWRDRPAVKDAFKVAATHNSAPSVFYAAHCMLSSMQ